MGVAPLTDKLSGCGVMRFGVFNHGWWKAACEAAGHDVSTLPVAQHPSGNAYSADLASRIANGGAIAGFTSAHETDLWLDHGGTGLAFAPDSGAAAALRPLHEVTGVPLCSHLIDPLSTSLQGLDWRILWQSLQSPSWIKAVWDRAHAAELARFGLPNVLHLPMAAPDRIYDTTPLDPSRVRPIVSFVGGQNTHYFSSGAAVQTSSLFAGTLAQCARADAPSATFYDLYHDYFGLGETVSQNDDLDTAVRKVTTYYNAKLFYHASLCLQNRDRFVIFLKRRLGERFQLIGRGWDSAYGLPCQPAIGETDDYYRHFRDTAVNINLVNGNAETGLNMRHFEITAAGGFMLCYEQPELESCFQIGKECAVFRSEADLLEKIDYFLHHPEERNAIALAGQRRTLSQHLYRHRLARILQVLAPSSATVQFAETTWSQDCKKLLPEADVILDCGANVGQMAVAFRQLYPHAEIYSFEPVAAVFEQLRRRCNEIGVRPVQCAVADCEGKRHIFLTTSSEANSLLEYQEGNPCAQWTGVLGEEEVEVRTLDGWCADNAVVTPRVDLIKLDIQGAELLALYGARKLLETARLILLEVSFVPIYKDCPLFPEIDSFLTECGYRRHALYPSDQPQNWGDALYVKTV